MGVTCSRQTSSQDDALLAAIRDGDAETVQKSLAGYRLKASKYYFWLEQVSALHVASNEGHFGVLQALVEVAKPSPEAASKEKHNFSAFLNRSNSYGQTALMLACKNGHVACVRYLLEMGADPLVPDKVHSRTCLHYAAWNGWANCIEVLLSETTQVRLYNGTIGGADSAVVTDACGRQRLVDIRSESGFTPLHFAVSASNAAAVRVLLERGACWSAEVLMGACYSIWPTRSIPLHIAAAKGSISVAKLLLQAQANSSPNSADMRLRLDSNGKRPLDIARQLGHTRLEHMLDPAIPLRQALSSHAHRASRIYGSPPLTVLASKAVQAILFGQLDYLAWQLRIRDGASAAMPSSLRRQLMKSSRAKQGKAQPAGQLSSSGEGDLPTGGEVTSCPAADDADMLGGCADCDPAVEDGGLGALASTSGAAVDSVLASGYQYSDDASAAEDAPPGKWENPPDVAPEEASPAAPLPARGSATGGSHEECGVCLDRRTQLQIGGCKHECCYECAMTLVKKTKVMKSSIRCPFCRGVIGSFHLKDKANQPLMIGKAAA